VYYDIDNNNLIMFEKKIESTILIISTLIFAIILQMFAIHSKAYILIMGYLVVVGLVLLHYDLHITTKHKSPFKSAYLEHLDAPLVERLFMTIVKGFFNRIHHFYKKENILSHAHFLIQPTFLYWSVCSILFFFINPWLSGGLIIVASLCFMLILASISMIYKKKLLIEEKHFHILSITKMLIVFLSFMASYGYYFFRLIYGYNAVLLAMATTVVLLYQFAWSSGKLFKKELVWPSIFWAGLFTAAICLILVNNLTNYYFAVVCLFATYYVCFGILKHYIKGDLTKKIALEYLIYSVLLVALIWANTYFGESIL